MVMDLGKIMFGACTWLDCRGGYRKHMSRIVYGDKETMVSAGSSAMILESRRSVPGTWSSVASRSSTAASLESVEDAVCSCWLALTTPEEACGLPREKRPANTSSERHDGGSNVCRRLYEVKQDRKVSKLCNCGERHGRLLTFRTTSRIWWSNKIYETDEEEGQQMYAET